MTEVNQKKPEVESPVAPVLVTYMGRGRGGKNPFRFFWNRSDATATHVYLLLIPRGELAALLRRDPAAASRIVDFLTQIPTEELSGHGRVYGGGLFKLEPKELGSLEVREWLRHLRLDPPPEAKEGGRHQLVLGFGSSEHLLPAGEREELLDRRIQ